MRDGAPSRRARRARSIRHRQCGWRSAARDRRRGMFAACSTSTRTVDRTNGRQHVLEVRVSAELVDGVPPGRRGERAHRAQSPAAARGRRRCRSWACRPASGRRTRRKQRSSSCDAPRAGRDRGDRRPLEEIVEHHLGRHHATEARARPRPDRRRRSGRGASGRCVCGGIGAPATSDSRRASRLPPESAHRDGIRPPSGRPATGWPRRRRPR